MCCSKIAFCLIWLMLAKLHLVRQGASCHLQHEQNQMMHLIITMSGWSPSSSWLVHMCASNQPLNECKTLPWQRLQICFSIACLEHYIKNYIKKSSWLNFIAVSTKQESRYYCHSFVNSSIFITLTALSFRNVMNLYIYIYMVCTASCVKVS